MKLDKGNKDHVIKAVTELFIQRDVSAAEKYWSPDYIQHNPRYADGADKLAHLISSLPQNFRYEMGQVAAEGDFVFIHGRYTGIAPKPLIAVDMYRVEDGKIAEHWDVLQEEVPARESKGRKSMFTGD